MNSDERDELLRYLDKVHHRTRRVAACIPPEHLEWKPRPEAWSPGDLVRHLAALERFMFAENARGEGSLYPGHGRELADGLDEVLAYFDRMHEESMAIFRSLSPEDLERRTVTPGGAEIRIWKWLRSMVEHEAHHRGQLYLLLGQLGVGTPPLYGLTSEEVRDRSARG